MASEGGCCAFSYEDGKAIAFVLGENTEKQ